jgi:hypothetical protein
MSTRLKIPTQLLRGFECPARALGIDISDDTCEDSGGNAQNQVVYATNLNSNQTVDAKFKYDSVPAQQHFILFDASLNPVTDRFPKSQTRRLAPGETAAIGCTVTYRASPRAPGPMAVPIAIAKQSASYVDPSTPAPDPADARSFAAFYLQGGANECGAGAKPPGLLYLVSLHPYARLSASINLLDDRGKRVGAQTIYLPPLSASRVACSNGVAEPGPITNATLEISAGAQTLTKAVSPPVRDPAPPEANATQTLPPPSVGLIFSAQDVCAGSSPAGWIKINDAWNPTVCGKPATITYNVWTLRPLGDPPIGAVIHACRASVPTGWVIIGTTWNPTVCGHPATNQSNIMAIKRLN